MSYSFSFHHSLFILITLFTPCFTSEDHTKIYAPSPAIYLVRDECILSQDETRCKKLLSDWDNKSLIQLKDLFYDVLIQLREGSIPVEEDGELRFAFDRESIKELSIKAKPLHTKSVKQSCEMFIAHITTILEEQRA